MNRLGTRPPRRIADAILPRRLRVLAAVTFLWGTVLATALLFLAFQGRRVLFLRLDLDPPGGAAATGEIWWTARQRPFHPADSIAFRAAAGRRTIAVPIPVEIDTIQVRPGGAPGTELVVHAIELRTAVASLHRWDREHGFAGWHAVSGLTGFRVAGGVLRMRRGAANAAFAIDDIQPLRDSWRRRQHLRLALAAGLVAGVLQTVALLLLTSGRGGVRPAVAAAAQGAGAPPSASPRVAAALVFVAAVAAACVLAAWLAGRRLLPRPGAAVFTETGDYSLVFVDHLGRRLSEKNGSLRLALDPYCLYRNAPNQRTSQFWIDAHGYRGGFDEGDRRPRLLLLGGSVAFGYGLPSDADVVTARLSALEPRWQAVNAAVAGYLSGQELSELVHYSGAVAPAAVVALDGWNDVYVPLLTAPRFPAVGLGVGFNWDVFNLVERRLRLFTLGGAAEPPAASRDEPIPDLARRVTATYAANLEQMQRLCASRGIGFLVVLQPWVATRRTPPAGERQALAEWLDRGPRAATALYAAFREDTRKVLAASRIPCLDLNQSSGFVDGDQPLFDDVVHPNAQGHLLMASLIHARLAELASPRHGVPPAR